MAAPTKQSVQLVLALVVLAMAIGAIVRQLFPPRVPHPFAHLPDPYANIQGPIVFHDDVESNSTASSDQLDLTFVDANGKSVRVADLRGKKHVVLVITRGYYQARCPYCTAQTSRLITNHARFVERDAEVLVVYPGPQDHLNEFLEAVQNDAYIEKFPFAMLFDQDLKGVDQLGIRWQLARPSTFILDKQGNLCFAYVGKDIGDRPSIEAMLAQLDKLSTIANP